MQDVEVSDDDYDVISIFFGSCKLCIDSILDEIIIYVRCGLLPVTVSTRLITYITCLVGDPYKPSFATGILQGGHTTQNRSPVWPGGDHMFSSTTPQIHSILSMLRCSLQNAVSRMSDIDVNDAFAKRMAQVNLGVFDV